MSKNRFLLSVMTFLLILSGCSDLIRNSAVGHLKVSTPEIEPQGGEYSTGQQISITVENPDATIYYSIYREGVLTEEGIYTSPLQVGEHGKRFIVEAVASMSQALDSDTVREEYRFIYNRLSPPVLTFNPPQDPLGEPNRADTHLIIENAPDSAGAQLWYNIPQHPDFAEDTGAYQLYTEPVLLLGDNADYTINAYAATESLPQSLPVTDWITIEYPFLTPISPSPLPGAQPQVYSVTLEQAEFAELWVTTDGSDPQSSETRFLYENPIAINDAEHPTIIRVYPQLYGYKSLPFEGEYSINPEICPSLEYHIDQDDAAGRLSQTILDDLIEATVVRRNYTLWLEPVTGQEIPTSGAIFYTMTTDGSDPPFPLADLQTMTAVVGQAYDPAIGITVNEGFLDKRLRIKALCYAPGYSSGSTLNFDYTLQYLIAAEPVLNFSGDTLSNQDQSFTVNFNTSNAAQLLDQQLQYSTDGGTTWISTTPGSSHSTSTNSGEDQSYSLLVRSINSHGQLSDHSYSELPIPVRVDKEVPSAPVLTPQGFYQNNSVNYQNISNESSAGFTWTGGETTLYYSIGGIETSLTAGSTAIASAHASLVDGDYTIEGWLIDSAGNRSPNSTGLDFSKDTQAPGAPVLTQNTLWSGSFINTTLSSALLGWNAVSNSDYLIGIDSGSEVAITQNQIDLMAEYPSLSQGSHSFSLKVRDAAGNSSTAYTLPFTKDTVAQGVSSISPVHSSSNVAVGGNILVSFDGDMDSSTINSSNITLSPATGASYSYNSATRQLTINPTGDLNFETAYTCTVSSNVRDSGGNPVSATSSQFSTPNYLRITWTSIADGATNVSLNQTLTVQFDQDIQTSTLIDSNITLDSTRDPDLPVDVSFANNSRGTIDPRCVYRLGEYYTVAFGDGVRSVHGAPILSSQRTMNFTVVNSGTALLYVTHAQLNPYVGQVCPTTPDPNTNYYLPSGYTNSTAIVDQTSGILFNNAYIISHDNSTVSTGSLRFDIKDDSNYITTQDGILIFSFNIRFTESDHYLLYIREKGSSSQSFLTTTFAPSQVNTDYISCNVRIEIVNGTATSYFFMDRKIVSSNTFSSANVPGALLVGHHYDTDTNGEFYITNIRAYLNPLP